MDVTTWPHVGCGIRSATSTKPGTAAAIADIVGELGKGPFQHIIVFFSPAHHVKLIAELFRTSYPGVAISGCSTSGEFTPQGMTRGGIVAVAFPSEGFRVVAEAIYGVDQSGVEEASELARRIKARFGSGREMRDRVFALMLVDGLSNAEEMLIAAVHWAMDDVQLIGGSAGDDLAFRETSLIHNGRVLQHAALLIMVESDVPFRVFKSQNFEPTGAKLVVTAADTERRIVHELNAEPAAQEYASAIGLLPEDLGPFSFASYPLVVRVGGDYYCRSIRNMNQDGSLSFFCAIDEGLVFTVANPQDMVQATLRTLEGVEQSLGGIDMVLGFDCILRRLDAENRQIRHQLSDIYRRFRMVGFHTYGEQFNAMHLNQTLTGIAFGQGRASPEARG
ncbi:MAG: FIST N-terminal domain-containing protein [Hyphomicrobiaceae bacterium]